MRYKIYQAIHPTFRVDESQKTYNRDDYNVVYEGEEKVYTFNRTEFLEHVFEKFNIGVYPEDYKGHSLSVGDIVEVETGEAYICAAMGWSRIDFAEDQ